MAGDGNPGNPNPTTHPRMGAGLPGGLPGSSGSPTGTAGVTDTLRQAASSVGDVAGQVRDKAQDLASGAASRLEDAYETTRQGLRQGADYVTDAAQNLLSDTTALIRRYPLASVLIAFGAGCLCASLFNPMNFRGSDMTDRMSRHSA
jgi:ElaB/YqjD/DUF883 family membrane-anchored ribosome-binding protein